MTQKIEITFYDFVDLYYASFFLAGFHARASLGEANFLISKRVPKALENLLRLEEWKHILFSVLLFKFRGEGREFFFCIDARDSSTSSGTGKGYHLPLLGEVQYYFKVNYRKSSIESDAMLEPYAHKIIPASPFFPIKLPSLTSYLPNFYSELKAQWDFGGAITRFKQIRALPALQKLRKLRDQIKTRDVFFVVGYYPGHEEDNEFRYQLMQELRQRSRINAITGFVGRDLPDKYRKFQIDREIPLYSYLSEVAASKVAIYVRGVHDCLSFKLGQLLAMGMPIVGQSIFNNRENLMSNPHFDVQFAYETPAKIAGRIEQLLQTPQALQQIALSNAAIFDTKYTPQKAVGDIMDHLLAKTV